MRAHHHKYRNSLRPSALIKWIVFIAFLGAVATSFVQIRNRHVVKGIEIREIEDRIVALEAEIEMYDLKIIGMMNRRDLSKRLSHTGMELVGIRPENRIVVVPVAATEEEEAMLAVR